MFNLSAISLQICTRNKREHDKYNNSAEHAIDLLTFIEIHLGFMLRVLLFPQYLFKALICGE